MIQIRHKVILQSRHRVIPQNRLTLRKRQVICVNPSYQLVRTLGLIIVCREQLQQVVMKTHTRNIVLPVRYRDQPRCADGRGDVIECNYAN